MICPHCNKPIHRTISKEAIAMARDLRHRGHTFEDIQSLLKEKGFHHSIGGLFKKVKIKWPKR